jgi:hypothetical protein
VNTLDVLRAAREYISDPARWTQGIIGRSDGSRCAVGALKDAAGHGPKSVGWHSPPSGCGAAVTGAYAALERVAGEPPPLFNDSHTHAEVLAAFDRAIAVEEAKAAEFTAASEPAPLVAA